MTTHRLTASLSTNPPDLRSHWRQLINLGYAANLAGSEIGDSIRRIRSEIGFRYGRICRITDLITEYEINGELLRDYSAIFSLLDHLRENQMIPFLELGNKSFLIQETTSLSYTPVSPSDSRAYYDHLAEVLPDFASACINHYGQDYFDSWYFEISYMYTDETTRETFGFTQYTGMFRRIYQILRRFSPHCRIGGPGFNDWSDSERLTHALKRLCTPKLSPDFFSAYLYPVVVNKKGTSSLSRDPELVIERLRKLTELVRSFRPDMEIWITEFNSNLSARNFLNDSCYQAAFLSHILFASAELRVNAIGYYLLSDTPLHYFDALDFLFGGWGLLSDRNLPKPSYAAYRLFSMLGHYFVKQTRQCLITANSRESYRILFYRYAHPRAEYCKRNVTREDLLSPELLFIEPEEEAYQVTLRHIPNGTLLIKEYRVDDAHANLFHAWSDMGFLNPREAHTLEELHALSLPTPRLSTLQLRENEELQLTLHLDTIGLCLVTVDLYEPDGKGGAS